MTRIIFLFLLTVLVSAPLEAQDGFLVKEPEHPTHLTSLPNGSLQADFGRVAFGQLDIRLTSRTGRDTVVLHLGERAVGGRIWRTPTTSVRYRSQVVPLQKGTHVYPFIIEPDKRNTGRDAVKMPASIGEVLPFRWLEVENYRRKLRAEDITRYAVHVPFRDDAASFRCSNDTLNQLWDLCKYTVKATSFTGYYVDGDRERIPYEADALINQLCHYAADCEFTTARRTLAHLLDHPTWPTEWILQAIPIAWNDWLYSGDDTFIKEHYFQLKARTLLDLRTENGLISTTTGLQTPEFLASINRTAPIRDIVDWPHSGGTGLAKGQGGEDDGYVYTDCNTVVNAWFYHALVQMEAIARHLGYPEDAGTFHAAARKVQEVFDDELYDPVRGVYVDGIGTSHAALHANLFPLLFGLVPEERQPRVVDFIKSRGMACSVYGAQFLLDALYEAGEADYALRLLTSDGIRSWYNMLRVGSTLTLEAWDDSFKPNQDWNHAWGAAPGNLLPFRLMGFQPLEPGCGRIRIHPQTASLEWAEAQVPTVRGPVTIRVRDGKVDVDAPEGVEVVLGAPRPPLREGHPALICPEDYRIDPEDHARAMKILHGPQPDIVFPNPSAGAQWFPQAGLGLFMHWGIHSLLGAQPSWNMIKDYEWGGEYHSREEYYGQAYVFDPQDYHPERYLKAAAEAGFTYAVLTTRHHDGYALWPSKYGIGTKQYMHGRDLLRDYVDACRASGLKVGFYYSPRDWHYPGDRPETEWDTATWGKRGPVQDTVANRRDFEQFFSYVIAQLEELLTNYGKIDVLWLDGMGWYGIPVQDLCTEKVYAWIRSLQPDIVINDRWGNIVNPDNPAGTAMRIGDFTTPFECTVPTYIPSAWWDHCHIWTGKGGGWGYNQKGVFRPMSWFMESYVACRSLGGNFLINVGPAGTGDMHPNWYKEVAALKDWIATGAESVCGNGPTPGVELSNVPLTTRGNDIWYAHMLAKFKGQVSVKTGRKPSSVVLLRTGKELSYLWRDGFLNVKIPAEDRCWIDDVIKITF